MNAIQELLKTHCPNGVEFKALGEVANFRRGSFPQPYTKTEWYGGEDSAPFVQVADVGDNMKLTETTKQTISKIAQLKSVFVPKNTVIVTLQGSIGRVAITQYDSYVDRTLAIFQSYKIPINIKFFAYVLFMKFDEEKKKARGGIIKTITVEEFKKFQIPIPPLIVQEKIVSILDTFTELEARKKQYAYYREKLLSFDYLDSITGGALVIWLWVRLALLLVVVVCKKAILENLESLAYIMGRYTLTMALLPIKQKVLLVKAQQRNSKKQNMEI